MCEVTAFKCRGIVNAVGRDAPRWYVDQGQRTGGETNLTDVIVRFDWPWAQGGESGGDYV